MMRTERVNLVAQVRAYVAGELDESELDLFWYDLDQDDALRAAAWHTYEMLRSQEPQERRAA